MRIVDVPRHTGGAARLACFLLLATLPLVGIGASLQFAGAAAPNPSLSRGASLGGGITCRSANAQTNEGAPIAIDVLSGCQSLDGAQVQSVSQPSDGASTINPNNTVTYSPNPAFSGQDSFQFTASDLTGLFTSTASVYITVSPTSTTTTTTTSTSTSTSVTTSTTTTSTSTSTSGGTSTLTVESQLNGGGAMTGFYTVLYQNGAGIASGYTPATFTLNDGQTYSVQVDGYGSYYFQFWAGSGSVNGNETVVPNGDLSMTAVLCNGPPGTCADATPVNGITVYAHRIPASYWAPCFATACSAGTGPGATMFFQLYDSSGNLLQSAYADEAGYTFTGLTPGVTYYVWADNCNLCHGSTHDVVFQYWGAHTSTANPIAATVGSNLDAWYSCTNGCSGV